MKHIETRARLANLVVMYSNTCTRQNRNWKTAKTLMKPVQSKNNNIEVVEKHFIQRGHSYIPDDCDLASVGNFSRMQQIFTPSGWYTPSGHC